LRVAPTNANVLLLGESGVGKTMFSHEVHANSRQKTGPFVEVNCAAIPDQLIESELFGVHRGAYSGATESRPGRFEAADGGTLFLDEIATLSMTAQSKLLRVLQSGELERLGSNKTVRVNVRLVAATNEDLRQAVKEGRFRSDLYYRLNVFPITIAPLRERKDDLPVLLESTLEKLCTLHGRNLTGVTPKALQKILDHNWPGNIREFENVIERGVIMADDNQPLNERHLSGLGELEDDQPTGTVSWEAGPGIGIKLPAHKKSALQEDASSPPIEERLANIAGPILSEGGFSLARAEVIFVEKALHMTSGNVSKAAALLGLTRAQLDYRLKKLSTSKPDSKLTSGGS
jgi:transcriptional regulator with PAS, ATPase and Fis domain